MYWSHNFLALVFKKLEISQQVVTRMQDLASEFSKIFRGWYPWTLTEEGVDPIPHPTPSPAFGPVRGASARVLGPKSWSPWTFQPWLHAPLSEDVTCGERMGGDSETLTSAAESWVSSECGLVAETEEVVFPDVRRSILPVCDLEWPLWHTSQWRDYVILIIILISSIVIPNVT